MEKEEDRKRRRQRRRRRHEEKEEEVKQKRRRRKSRSKETEDDCIVVNVGNKIVPMTPVETPTETQIVDVEVKKSFTCCWSRVKMIKMVAWYFIPTSYLIFNVAYFTLYTSL